MSLLVCVLLLNGNKCQDNEGNQMFDDKLAAVESRFKDQIEDLKEMLRLKDENINQLSTKLSIMDEEIKVHKNTETNMIEK